ncbi:restriction endonuclease subunit S [uncultured Maribacter sp.]|uniref:restriction endonuclease subunit S n=1 Tax=uncultured Maribacter sp. TaxID=431308 RepID=UPI0030EDC589|tara:strand:+ start:4903 stop:6003 length:1101 start_codon:yes stop_codon:yes gene_type:complete
MPENWKTYKLGEILHIKNGKTKPKNKGIYPIYGGNGILGYGDKTNLNEEAILIGRVGAYCGAVYYENRELWVSDNSLFGIAKNKNNSKFIYYLLKKANLNQFSTGSSQPLLTQGTLNSLEFEIPENDSEQRAIANILSAIDNKIENNLAMNKTLEDMAMTLYKHWFVDFGPFKEAKFVDSELGKIPEGWQVIKLEQLVEIKYGKDHKKLDTGSIPVYGSGGIMRYVDTFLYDSESVLVPRKGTLSNIFLVNQPFWSVDTMFYTKMRKENILKYTFHLLKTMKLADMDVGSAIPSLTTKLLNFLDIILPDEDVLRKFEIYVTELYEQIWANTEENQTLTNLRDTLLPKFISGEVRLKEFEKEITAAL